MQDENVACRDFGKVSMLSFECVVGDSFSNAQLDRVTRANKQLLDM